MDNELEKGTAVEVPKTPTPDERVATLEAELAKARAQAEEKEKGFKTLQRELSERDKKLGSLSSIQEELQATREDQKMLAAYVASLAGKSEDDFEQARTTNKDALLKQLDEKEKQRQTARQQKELQDKAEAIRQRVEAAGYTPETDEYHQIRGLVRNGDFEYAELKLKKLEEKKPVTNTEKPETKEPEDQKIERLVKERLQKLMEEKGLLVSDAGTPATGVSDYAEAARKYAAGDISREEFAKHRR